MRRNRRLPREEYLALKKFKKQTNSERANKLVRDHRGIVYKVQEDGSLRRVGTNASSSNGGSRK